MYTKKFIFITCSLFSLSCHATENINQEELPVSKDIGETTMQKEEPQKTMLKNCAKLGTAAAASTLLFGTYAYVRSGYVPQTQIMSELAQMCTIILGGCIHAMSHNSPGFICMLPSVQKDETAEIKQFSTLESLKYGLIATAIIGGFITVGVGIKAGIKKFKNRKNKKDSELILQEFAVNNKDA